MSEAARALPLRSIGHDATPVQHVSVQCPMCGLGVRVPVVREFVRVFRRLSALAGVRCGEDLPMFADRCPRGHVVIVSLGKVVMVT